MADRNIGAEAVRWDLSVFYKTMDDPQLDADFSDYAHRAEAFNKTYKGNLTTLLGRAISDYAELGMLGGKIGIYLMLLQTLNVADAKVKAKVAEVDRAMSGIEGEFLTFFDIELVAISDETLAKLYETDEVVKKHRPWIEHIRIFKPHLLSEPVESALTKRTPFGPGAWSEFFDECEADLRFRHADREITLTEALHIMSDSKDAAERAAVLEIVNQGLGTHFAKYSAQTLYMVAGKSAVERKDRNYRHPMEARNKSNRISDAVAEALHAAVVEAATPFNKRHYRLKAKLLGMDTLAWSDRSAPLPFTDTTVIPFGEALETVLAAYESFSPTLAGIIRDFIAEKRIDAPAVPGKQSGAFNSSFVLPGNRPISFTLLNYLGSSRDVMTLAHELGHGVHAILGAEAQGPLMFHAPIAYAETASVFGEMTAFNFLKKRMLAEGKKEALLALLIQKIDDMANTVVRQIGFSNFERRLHGMDEQYAVWGDPKKLSVEELNGIWLETLKELYGEEGEVFTYKNAEHLWTYVSHFHRPFYVYGYAFGELLTQSLYAQQERLGADFEKLYLDLLRAGGTKNASELLAPFGLDPADPAFWAKGIELGMGKLIQEAEVLAHSLQPVGSL